MDIKIASSSRDHLVKIWDAETFLCLSTLKEHTKSVSSVAWSPDGQKIVSGSHDHKVKIWDAENYLCLNTLSEHTMVVSSVAWSPDGHRIVSGCYDHGIKIWNVSDYCECPYFNKFEFEFQFID